jgi:MFS family permease
MLYIPAVKLFYAENSLDDYELFLLHAIYSFVIFTVEIPSGYFADVWGRKKTIIAGMFFGIIGFGTYSFSYSFLGFLLAELALGIGQGFISGSDTAILYDTLAEQHKTNKYLKYESRITGSGNFAEALAGIVFTILAFNSMRGYYYIQTGITVIGFLWAWFLVEPRIHISREKVSLQSIFYIVRETLWKKPQLSRYIFLSSIVGFASLSMAWFAQIFLFNAGVEKANFGIVWTALNLMVALGSFSAHKADRFFGPRNVLIYIIVFLSGGFILSSQTISFWGIGFLLVFYFVRGTAHPIMKERINKLTESKVRATVFSVRSLIIRALFALLGPALGWYTERISLSFALILAGLIVLLPGFFLVGAILRSKK